MTPTSFSSSLPLWRLPTGALEIFGILTDHRLKPNLAKSFPKYRLTLDGDRFDAQFLVPRPARYSQLLTPVSFYNAFERTTTLSSQSNSCWDIWTRFPTCDSHFFYRPPRSAPPTLSPSIASPINLSPRRPRSASKQTAPAKRWGRWNDNFVVRLPRGSSPRIVARPTSSAQGRPRTAGWTSSCSSSMPFLPGKLSICPLNRLVVPLLRAS